MAPTHQQVVYQKDEKVLCFHHELLYEAKVLDSKPSDPNDKKSPLHYRVHYKGWKNTYVVTLYSRCSYSLGIPLFHSTSSSGTFAGLITPVLVRFLMLLSRHFRSLFRPYQLLAIHAHLAQLGRLGTSRTPASFH